MIKGWVGFDLDGTIAYYDGWKGINHIGEPIWPMIETMKKFLEQDYYDVKIFTARMSNDEESKIFLPCLHKWLIERCGLPKLEATCKKDFQMVMLFDDRAIQVIRNTGKIIGN